MYIYIVTYCYFVSVFSGMYVMLLLFRERRAKFCLILCGVLLQAGMQDALGGRAASGCVAFCRPPEV